MGAEYIAPTEVQSPDRPACSKSMFTFKCIDSRKVQRGWLHVKKYKSVQCTDTAFKKLNNSENKLLQAIYL